MHRDLGTRTAVIREARRFAHEDLVPHGRPAAARGRKQAGYVGRGLYPHLLTRCGIGAETSRPGRFSESGTGSYDRHKTVPSNGH